MFFTYVRRELRGRMGQALFTAPGPALAIGLAGAELVTKLSPKLTAVVGQTTGSATPGGGGGGGGGGLGGASAAFRNASATARTVAVYLAASASTGGSRQL
jgi:hypothetical protein